MKPEESEASNSMITHRHVSNFKSLKTLDIRLRPLNVLSGPNMSGKSNILDVFRFLYELIFPQAGGVQGLSYALAQRGGVNEVLWKGGDDKLISIALNGVDDSDPTSQSQFEYKIELLTGIGDFVTIQTESLVVERGGTRTDLINREKGFAYLKNLDGSIVGNAAGGDSSALQYPQPNWDGFRMHQWIKSWRFYHLIPPAMRQPSLMSLGQVLQPSGENLSAWLMWLQAHSVQSFIRVNEVLRDIFPDVIEVKTIPTPDGRVHLATSEKGLKRPTFVWQTSDGFLVLTALLSLIYVPPVLSGTLFCIEEPENHLHPRILETLVALLRQVRREVLDAHGILTQLFITTQSPYLLDQFSIDDIIWVQKREGATEASRPSDQSHLKKLVEDKELGLGGLMYSGVLGEGK